MKNLENFAKVMKKRGSQHFYKEYKTRKGAEKFYRSLCKKYAYVAIVDFPKTEAGIYEFLVK